MKKKINFIVAMVLFSSLSIIAQELPSFKSMDVFELEWVTNPMFSPDGSKIVYQRNSMDIMKDQRQSRLWLINADGTDHIKLTHQDVNEGNAKWSPTGDRIAFTSSTENGSELFVYWLTSGKVARLSQLDRSPRGLSWSPDGSSIAFAKLVPESEPKLISPPSKPKGAEWAPHPKVITRVKHEADGSGYTEPGYTHFFIIPAEGGTARQVTQGNFNYGSNPMWSADGKKLITSATLDEDWEYNYRNSEIYSVLIASGEITQLTERQGPDHSPVLSPDGSKIAYLGYDDKVQTYQINELYLMNSDGSGKSQISFKHDRNISNLRWNSTGTGLFYQYDDKGNTKIGYTDLNGSTRVVGHNLGGTSIGRPYGGGSFSLSGRDQVCYTHTTPYHPAEIAVIGQGEESPQLITDLNHDILDYRDLAKVEEIWYKSSFDQRDIQGWIVYPPGFNANNTYPLIVENHGGPISNYGDRFSPEIQLLASGGYVVFYPNPRGSTGYGEEFGNLLYHNYPGEDYNDVMDGVDAILKKGYTSEDSLFVTGGSAGGIMTAWMIGKNNRFRSAAVIKPVMNWISKTLTADNYFYYADYRYPGQPWENIEAYMKFSPVSLVGNIETPTLVMVGTSDLRTPLSEAKQLYHALKLRKIDTALVEVPGAPHFIGRRPSQLITKIEHILAWFEKYR